MKPRLFKTRAGFEAFIASHIGQRPAPLFHVNVLHDDWCDVEHCKCRPWYQVEDLNEETFKRGAQAAAKWAKEKRS